MMTTGPPCNCLGDSMQYRLGHLRKLADEAHYRFGRLIDALNITPAALGGRGDDAVQINAVDVRLAVDSFKAILTEIRRLK